MCHTTDNVFTNTATHQMNQTTQLMLGIAYSMIHKLDKIAHQNYQVISVFEASKTDDHVLHCTTKSWSNADR